MPSKFEEPENYSDIDEEEDNNYDDCQCHEDGKDEDDDEFASFPSSLYFAPSSIARRLGLYSAVHIPEGQTTLVEDNNAMVFGAMMVNCLFP